MAASASWPSNSPGDEDDERPNNQQARDERSCEPDRDDQNSTPPNAPAVLVKVEDHCPELGRHRAARRARLRRGVGRKEVPLRRAGNRRQDGEARNPDRRRSIGEAASLPAGAFREVGLLVLSDRRGIDERPVEPDRVRKSIGAEATFATDIVERDAAQSELTPLVAKVRRHCEAKQLSARTMTLKVKYADFQAVTRSRTVPGPFTGSEEVEWFAQALLDPLFPVPKGIL
ncbi:MULTISPECIES: hypothetical protein [Bosea]|uniref:DinB/UmuC family translesion DNA polymerase n=1 Tax=Bosea TaxID=85413 RepID=UPI0021AA2937|nr:hypothetical protein [Bosea spartocytisi]MCT4475277.1 hypothetical protein [Bosea spartocytisi]